MRDQHKSHRADRQTSARRPACRLALTIGLVLLTAIIGCQKRSPTKPLGSATTTPSPVEANRDVAATPEVGSTQNETHEPTANDSGQSAESKASDPAQSDPNDNNSTEATHPTASAPDAANSEATNTATATVTETDAAVDDAEPHVDTERFLLLLPDGPLVIDLRMTIDGQSHVVVFDRLVDEVAALADTDGDGRATWAEVIDSPRFKYGQLGNIAVNTPNERQQVLQLYDIDNDGLFDRNEIPRFLTRNAGGSRPFSLTSSNEYRRANRYQSPLLGWLDTDGDGALAADECEAAAARLRTRDSNEDELLAASDFRETSNQAMAMISGRRRVSEPDTAFLISSRVDWGSLLFSLEETYSFRDRIRSDAFDRKDGLFTAVDENLDGVWQVDELPNLLAVPPHLLFAADFGKPAEPPATDTDSAETDSTAADAARPDLGRPSLRLLERHASLGDSEATVVTYVGRIVLRLPDATVEFFVNDMLAANDGRAAAMAQFNQLDADSNGYLDTDEYSDEAPPLQVPFAALDADGDGKAYLAEVEALLRQRQGAIRSQIRGRAADQEDALFTALDSDGDGRLNRRETELAGEVIQAMDGNQDGRVTPGEIQTSFVVGLVRGDPQQGNNLFVMPPPRRLTATDAPTWFTNMDANNDGFVSDREFLGTPPQFADLDTNQDGLLSPNELPVQQPSADQSSDAVKGEE